MIERLVRFAHSGEWSDLGLEAPAPEHMDKAKIADSYQCGKEDGVGYALVGRSVQR